MQDNIARKNCKQVFYISSIAILCAWITTTATKILFAPRIYLENIQVAGIKRKCNDRFGAFAIVVEDKPRSSLPNISAVTSIVIIVVNATQQESIVLKLQLDLYVRVSLLSHNRVSRQEFLVFYDARTAVTKITTYSSNTSEISESYSPSNTGQALHFTLYRSRKIYLSAHLFSIGERPWASEMESSENFSREQNRARKRIATENCKNSERLEFILACNPSSFRYRIFLLAKQQQKFLQNILFQ